MRKALGEGSLATSSTSLIIGVGCDGTNPQNIRVRIEDGLKGIYAFTLQQASAIYRSDAREVTCSVDAGTPKRCCGAANGCSPSVPRRRGRSTSGFAIVPDHRSVVDSIIG